MRQKTLLSKYVFQLFMAFSLFALSMTSLNAQTLAFPEATGFGRYTTGARGSANPQIYLVTNLNDSGPGSFRDAVSQEGRFVIFTVGGIINLQSNIAVSKNTTIAGQTATGEGVVFYGKRITFSGASNTIARYLRIRHGGPDKNTDASGLSNGTDMIFDHLTVTWGTDEVFSITWDNKGTSTDNITVQNSIIGQGMHRHNHSAGGLIQPADGKVSLIGNLYISNKTRNPKVKGINEFVNNVVYNWGNYGNTYGHTESGDAYIMGGDSAGISNVNIINNYFIGGPHTGTSISTPFNRGNSNFNLYGSGNYFDNNKNGALDGTLVPEDLIGYPTGDDTSIKAVPYDYPMKTTPFTAQQAFDNIILNVGASYPTRDQVDSMLIEELNSKGTEAFYLYRETDLPFINNGVGHVYGAPARLDSDNDGMPDVWEEANGLNKNDATDALNVSASQAPYLNIELYINGVMDEAPVAFIIPPSNVNFTNVASNEIPPSSSLTINWNDNADNEDNYVLERSTDGENFTLLATLSADETSYDDIGLVPNTMYYYRIKASNTTESSVYITTSITTLPIPSAPTKASTPIPNMGFNFVELSGGNVILKWIGSSNTETYSVYFGTEPNNLAKLGDVAYSVTPSYEVSGLSSSVDYFWRIDASNEKGNVTGDVWSFRTIANIPKMLVGQWKFDEALLDGEIITDYSTFANHGILDLSFDNDDVRVSGKSGNALDFGTSSSTEYMASIPNQDQLYFDQSSFSISLWMQAAPALMPTGSSSAYLLCKGSFNVNAVTGQTGKRYNIEFKDSQLRFAIDDNVTKKELSTSAIPFFSGNWEHVVIMRDVVAHRLRIYLNGVFISDLDETAVKGIGEVSDLVLGNIGEFELLGGTAPAPYTGKLDELKIYNYALTAEEVLGLYENVLSNNEASFIDYKNISVYPNPMDEQLNISIPTYKASILTATLSDLTGKVIVQQEIVSQGNGRFPLTIKNKLSAGIYILNVSGKRLNNNIKIVAK